MQNSNTNGKAGNSGDASELRPMNPTAENELINELGTMTSDGYKYFGTDQAVEDGQVFVEQAQNAIVTAIEDFLALGGDSNVLGQLVTAVS